MKRSLLSFCLAMVLALNSFNCMALTDSYYATGEDIDFLIESDSLSAILEIEYELRKFVIFRKVEDYLFSLSDSFSLAGE